MHDISKINQVLQTRLKQSNLEFVKAVEAAEWLSEAGVLHDSKSKPGKTLRDLLRQGMIMGQRQESNKRWFIDVKAD